MQNKYKKNYEGDYAKAYKDLTTSKREGQLRKREYDSVSKKLNDKPYNKVERSSSYTLGSRPEEAGRVSAEGRTAAVRNERRDALRDTVTREQEKVTGKVVSPPYELPVDMKGPTKQESRQQKNVYEAPVDDGNYNLFDVPIEEFVFGKYRNLKTQREIDANEARDVLKMAGYIPKSSTNFGTLVFVFIFMNIVASVLAPVVALGYGIMKLMSSKTTWVKRTPKQIYRFTLPASDEEMNINKMMGIVCIVAGVIAGFVHYQSIPF